MTDNAFIGWDIGGAHLKMAVIDPEGRVTSASQYPTPLWQGIDTLHGTLTEAARSCRGFPARHAVTTTAELADIFQDRQQGMQVLSSCLLRVLDKKTIQFYGGGSGWITPANAVRKYDQIASANWHATASYVASIVRNGLLLDIGSTTTDIIGFSDGTVCNHGYTDFERLGSGELVYTGIVRTPVMAVTDTVVMGNREHPLVAENFSTMADIYRLLGLLDENDDMMPSPDGAGKTTLDSCRRIARMTGQDISTDTDIQAWRAVAEYIAGKQKKRIQLAVEKVLSGMDMAEGLTIVGAGTGRFLSRSIAAGLSMPYVDFADLFTIPEQIRGDVARAAPAVSVAMLARQAL